MKATEKKQQYIFHVKGKAFIKSSKPANDLVIPFDVQGKRKIKETEMSNEALKFFANRKLVKAQKFNSKNKLVLMEFKLSYLMINAMEIKVDIYKK